MGLAVVRSIGSAERFRNPAPQAMEELEQELVDQYALAAVGAGLTDGHIAQERSTVFEFLRFLGRPLWTVGPQDADRFLAHQRRERGNARSTVQSKAWTLARFYQFVIDRYQGDIHTLTGAVVVQPVDEFNRPAKVDRDTVRVPPPETDVAVLFDAWRDAVPSARKYLPAARDYFAASLWRRAGLRITETVRLDIRDWRPDLGEHGRLHVRFGKGSMGRGPKPRMVPAINSVDQLMFWWLTDVRGQFGDDPTDPDAPLLPSERYDRLTGRCTRVGDDALRSGLAQAVKRWLPAWTGRLTPHGLRHHCASALYARGMDLKAIQELLGHEWLSTTTRYIHVHNDHIDRAWAAANQRVTDRFTGQGT
ncbi:site-specific tyrosine recombinase XerD [Amorphoplanes nipponensis]|uniref:Tyrosine recombinase XerD n=1 Tax=Actinoplanes nipponensis TaxID=135950 RepID=A0A919MSE8_9ACTN|nr:tyrosine-type recombinase/integrase [Actinoplanes nipponensis]GIE52503.1 tyrosine recombinase XerD [Actinoplanes nipponensis]